jgi:energy-coupling factor transporter transmembrane protein EcfT
MSAIGPWGTVILRSIDQAVRTHEAMTARGYTGSIPFGPMGAMGRRDRWVAILVPLLFMAAWLLVGREQG